MWILIMMLLIGLFASVWGFTMCFLPARWNRLTEATRFAGRCTEPSPKRVKSVIQLGNRVAGFAIFAVGCWFAYVASSELYLLLTGQVASQTATPAYVALPNSPTLALNALSAFMVLAGMLMAVFPAKAVAVFERAWPVAQSVAPSATPKVRMLVRLLGVIFTFLAIISLMH